MIIFQCLDLRLLIYEDIFLLYKTKVFLTPFCSASVIVIIYTHILYSQNAHGSHIELPNDTFELQITSNSQVTDIITLTR